MIFVAKKNFKTSITVFNLFSKINSYWKDILNTSIFFCYVLIIFFYNNCRINLRKYTYTRTFDPRCLFMARMSLMKWFRCNNRWHPSRGAAGGGHTPTIAIGWSATVLNSIVAAFIFAPSFLGVCRLIDWFVIVYC